MTALAQVRPERPMIVVIDGDEAVAHALKFRFELEGFDVRVGDDARSLMARGMIPDDACLVVDYNLPDTDGLQLLAGLRAVGLKAPVVMLVTNPSQSLRARALAAGIAVIEKPLLTDALLAAVNSALILKIV
ncbi:response regulator [Rhizobium sp. CRIBSB]|nr:response regulator [Rhizobium sp. CRIBSB]